MKKQRGFAAIQLALMLVAVLVLAGVGWYVWHARSITDKILTDTTKTSPEPTKQPSINSFDECAQAGNPIQESFPEVCVTKDGKRFTKPSQPPSDDSYAGWKSYTTKYDKMKFRYPPDMVLNDISEASTTDSNVTPGSDVITLKSATGFLINIHAGIDGIGGGCPECEAKFADPITLAGGQFYMNYIDTGDGKISNIAISKDSTSFIGNVGTHNITIIGTSNKAATIISGTFRDANDNIIGKSLADYKADHFVGEFKLLLKSISY